MHLFAETLPSQVAGKTIRVESAYYNTPMQRANGQAICPCCGCVGRKRKLCLSCVREGWRLVVGRAR